MRSRLLGAAFLAFALAGCSSPEVPDVDTGLPTSGVTASVPSTSTRAVPPATHQWKTDGLTCPRLTAAAASALGLTGEGKVKDSSNAQATGNSIDCVWGPGDDSATSATLHLDTATTQAAADANWQILSAALPEELAGVGEQAFTSADTGSNEIQVAVRSGNANLDIRLIAKKDDAATLTALRAAAPTIATDMLGALVPA